MKKLGKELSRVLAGILAAILVIQTPAEYAFAAEAEGDQIRESIDWGNAGEAVGIGLDKVSWQTAEGDAEVTGDEAGIDLAGVPLDTEMQWSAELTFTGLDENIMEPGDCVSFRIPEEYWHVQEYGQAVTLWGQTAESPDIESEVPVGYAAAEGNSITVTFDEGIKALEGTAAHGTLEIPVCWNQENLPEEAAGIGMELQAGSQLMVTVPAKPVQEPVPSEETEVTEETDAGTNHEQGTGKEEGKETENSEAVSGKSEKPSGEEDETGTTDTQEGQAGSGTKKGPLETVRRIFQKSASFLGIGEHAKSVPDEQYFAGGTTTKHIFSGSDVPEGFSTVKLTALSRKDGYSSEDKDTAFVRFGYEVYMDEDFLYHKSDEFSLMPGFPQQGDSSEDDYLKAVEEWLGEQPEGTVPDLIYTYELGDAFQDFVLNRTDLHSKTDADLVIGSYEIQEGILTVELNKRLYFMNNISLRFSFDAEADAAKLPPEKQEAVLDDAGKLVFQEIGTSSGGTGQTEKPKYSVEKEAPVNVTDNSITYEITVNTLAENESLNGKTLQDIMPESNGYKLKVRSFREKDSAEEIENAVDGDGNISYTFAPLEQGGGNKITTASFLLELELDDASYQSLIKNGSMNQMFSNQAKLIETGKTDPLAVSDTAKTQMRITFIGKKGKASNLEGNRYNWTIELNTSLPHMKDGFLVDTLCWTDHSYDIDKGVKITSVSKDGTSETEVTVPVRITGDVEWASLTMDALRTLADGKTEPFYYIFDTNDNNPLYGGQEGSTEKKQNAVMVIPYNGYANKKVTVSYDTVLNMNGFNSNKYVEKLTDVSYQPSIENKVNLLWDNVEGTGVGPGYVPQDEVNFGKTVTTDLNAVSKKGLSYSEKTHKVKWGIDVNRLGVNLTDVVLKDTLGRDKYDLSQLQLTYYKYHSTSHSLEETGSLEPIEGTPDTAGSFGYTLDKDTGELIIYLGNMETEKDGNYPYYSLVCETVLTDTAVLSNQYNAADQTTQPVQHITNKVALEAKYGGTEYKKEAEANLETPNTLIEKETVGSYDDKTHELSWKVTVNPDNVEIRDAKVTDTLEEGFTYGDLQKVEINGKENPERLKQIKENTAVSNLSVNNTVVWTLGDIGREEVYTLYFTTQATDSWRNEHMHCIKDGVSNLDAVTVPNDVLLEGTVGGVSITNATASASQAIEKKPLEKKGVMQYEDGEPTGEIVWTVWINKSQYNIGGYYLEEAIHDIADGEMVHELQPDSIKAEQYDGTNADGTDQFTDVTDPAKISTVDGSTNMNNGFRYTFPSDKSGNFHTYRITFSTWLTKAAESGGAKIENKVFLNDSGSQTVDESNVDDGGFHGGFDFDKAAAASPRPKIGLWKISENSIDTSNPNASDSLGLDAVFSLEGYKLENVGKDSSGGASFTLDAKESKYDKVRNVKAGDAAFLNINPGDDIVYVLHEESSHVGYQSGSSEPYFLYFVRDKDSLDGIADEEVTVKYEGKEYKGRFKRSVKDSEGKYNGGTLEKVIFTNTPNKNTFSFTKQELDKADYSYQNGVKNESYKGAEDIVFKVEPTSKELKNKVNTFYTKPSSADGTITLENLDPGTYRLTEVKASQDYANGGSVDLTVSVEEDGTYSFKLSDPKGAVTLKKDTDTLQNDLLRTDVSFTKSVQYQDEPKGSEKLEGAAFLLEGTTEGYTGSGGNNFIQLNKSNSSGKVVFKDIPVGTYKIYEMPEDAYGYLAGTESAKVHVYDLTVEETTDTTEVIGTQTGPDGSKSYYLKKAAAKLKVPAVLKDNIVSVDADNAEIGNLPIKGTVTLQKDAYDSELTGLDGGLEGAVFALYRKTGGNVDKSLPVYEAQSDPNGRVIFEAVEYGDYLLSETKAPTGYVKSVVTEYPISRSDLEISGTNHDSFTYEPAQAEKKTITNGIYKTDVSFLKKDVDGNPMEGISFQIYRRNKNEIAGDGGGMVVDVPESVTAYQEYTPYLYSGSEPDSIPDPVITSGADGKFTLKNIPYGDYLLKEMDGIDLQEDLNKMVIAVSVKDDGTGQNKTTVKVNHNFKGEMASVTTTGTDWEELTADQGVYTAVNHKQYGYVNVRKYIAEKSDSGQLNTDPDKGTFRLLEGAEFEIKKQAGTGTEGYKPYLTLVTGKDGGFQAEESGEHQGAYKDSRTGEFKHLFPGKYTIKEISAPDGFAVNAFEVPFEITPDTTGHEGCAWISLSGTGSEKAPYIGEVSYQKAGAELKGESPQALNEIPRGTVKLYKTDDAAEDAIPLHGAKFLVYALDSVTVPGAAREPAASLIEDGNTGRYVLSSQNPEVEGGILDPLKNKEDLPYLYDDGTEYRLLAGITYEIREVQAPQGYQISEAGKMFKPGRDESVVIEWKDQPIELKVRKTDQSGTTFLKGAEFSVTGVFAGKTAEETRKMEAGTDNEGLSVLSAQIAAGNTYTLKEIKAPDGYRLTDAEVEFTVDGTGNVTVTEDKEALASVQEGQKDTILFKNEEVAVTLKKTDSKDTGETIGGVAYELYDITNGQPGEKVQDVTTSEEAADKGTALMKKLVGNHQYLLKEISAPDIYQVSAVPVTFRVDEDGTLSHVSGGTIEGSTTLAVKNDKLTAGLHKKDAEGAVTLTGGSYEVRPAKDSRFAGDSQEAVTVTEADMDQKLAGKLKAGNSYVLTEVTAPQGYETAAPVTFTISAAGEVLVTDGTAEIETPAGQSFSTILLKDEPIEVSVRKTDPDGSRLYQAEFTIIPGQGSAFARLRGEKEAPKELEVTDSNADSMKARLIAENSYVITETKEPAGYIRLARPVTFSVKKDGTLEITDNPEDAASLNTDKTILQISNKQTRIYLDKISGEKAEDGSVQKVEGARLQIQKTDGTPAGGQEWTSDGENKGVITGLPAGKYQLAEVGTPYGYCTAKPVKFELRFDNTVLPEGADTPLEADKDGICTITMTDDVIRADAVLKKQVEGESTSVLEGVEFQCYRQEGDTPDLTKDELLKDQLTTGEAGTVGIDQLGEGRYYFLETKAAENTWLDGEHKIWQFEVTAKEHGQTIHITAENKRFHAAASVCKQDAEDKSTIAGTEFTLSRQTQDGWEDVSRALTDGEGEVSFELNQKGKYRLTETKAAQGYILDADHLWMQEFTADDSSYEKEFKWVAENERIGGTLSLEKADETDGSPLNDVIFTIYRKLADDSVQEIGSFATGQEYTGDDSGGYQGTAAKDGVLKINSLSWGTYYIQETKALDGYVPDTQQFEFTIDQKNLDIRLSAEPNGAVTNAQTRIWFYKLGKYAEECADGTLGDFPDGSSLIPLQGSEFTVYRDSACSEEVMSAVSRHDGLVEFYKLPVGSEYYIKETRASEGYLLNEAVYEAVLNESGTYTGIFTPEGEPIEEMSILNDVQRTDISLKKVSEQDPELALPGSVYGLFKRSAAITKGYSGNVRMQGENIGIRSRSYQNKALNEDVPQTDDEWVLIAKSVTDKNGMLVFKGVLMDTDYLIRELEAPDGSHVSEQPVTIRFGVDAEENIQVTDYHDGNGTAYVDPETGAITWQEPPIMVGVMKKDTGGSLLSGAKLALQDMDGNVLIRFTSSDKEPYVIYGDKMDGRLLAGHQYKLVEEEAPAGYLKAEPVIFTVEGRLAGPDENYVQMVEMVDEKIKETQKPSEPEPQEKEETKKVENVKNGQQEQSAKTGDGTQAGGSMLVMLAALMLAVIAYRRKMG